MPAAGSCGLTGLLQAAHQLQMLFAHLPALLLSRLNGRGYTLKQRLLLSRHALHLLVEKLVARLLAVFRLLVMTRHLLTEVTQHFADGDF
ncbi:hypothetical protein D3C76_1712330 [compost metagenome]